MCVDQIGKKIGKSSSSFSLNGKSFIGACANLFKMVKVCGPLETLPPGTMVFLCVSVWRVACGSLWLLYT